MHIDVLCNFILQRNFVCISIVSNIIIYNTVKKSRDGKYICNYYKCYFHPWKDENRRSESTGVEGSTRLVRFYWIKFRLKSKNITLFI